jgi:site-specific recombinase XerD
LDIGDIDLEHRTALVRNGKGGKDRLTLFGKPCHDALVAYLNDSRPVLANEAWEKTPALFLNRDGKRISVRSVQKMVRRYSSQVYTHVTQAEARKSLLEHHPRAKG